MKRLRWLPMILTYLRDMTSIGCRRREEPHCYLLVGCSGRCFLTLRYDTIGSSWLRRGLLGMVVVILRA